MGSHRRQGIILVVGLVALAAGLCLVPDAPHSICSRAQHWFVWGAYVPPPPSDSAFLRIPVDEDRSRAICGVIRYENGHRGAPDSRELPLRRLDVEVGALWVCIEDAARSAVPGSRDMVLRGEEVLVASIGGCQDPGMPRTLRHRFYRFRSGEPITLELPFSIEIALPADGSRPGSFRVELGDMHVEGLQSWHDLDELWHPMLERPDEARVGAVMVHGREGTRYASVSLDGVDPPEGRTCARTHWRLRAFDDGVVCEALETGRMSEDAEVAATDDRRGGQRPM